MQLALVPKIETGLLWLESGSIGSAATAMGCLREVKSGESTKVRIKDARRELEL